MEYALKNQGNRLAETSRKASDGAAGERPAAGLGVSASLLSMVATRQRGITASLASKIKAFVAELPERLVYEHVYKMKIATSMQRRFGAEVSAASERFSQDD